MWSVRSTATRRVVSHEAVVVLSDASFKVSEAGRQRVIREGRKNVHAGVEGFVESNTAIKEIPVSAIKVTYNPYKWNSFVDIDQNPVYHASVVYLDAQGKAYIIR
jgi:hypothetical protein